MGAILTFILYFLIVSIALVVAVLVARIFTNVLSHAFYIIPGYIWHNLMLLICAGVLVGGIVLLIVFA